MASVYVPEFSMEYFIIMANFISSKSRDLKLRGCIQIAALAKSIFEDLCEGMDNPRLFYAYFFRANRIMNNLNPIKGSLWTQKTTIAWNEFLDVFSYTLLDDSCFKTPLPKTSFSDLKDQEIYNLLDHIEYIQKEVVALKKE